MRQQLWNLAHSMNLVIRFTNSHRRRRRRRLRQRRKYGKRTHPNIIQISFHKTGQFFPTFFNALENHIFYSNLVMIPLNHHPVIGKNMHISNRFTYDWYDCNCTMNNFILEGNCCRLCIQMLEFITLLSTSELKSF